MSTWRRRFSGGAALLLALALAVRVPAGRAAPESQLDDAIVVQLLAPQAGDVLRGQVEIAGYAADRRSSQGSGLNERDIQLYLGDASDPRNLLDYAEPGQDSPAAAAALGPQFARAGFRASWETCAFPPGPYRLTVWVSSLVVPGARQMASAEGTIAPCPPGSVLYQDDFATEPGGVFRLRVDQPGSRFWGPAAVFADFAAGIDARCPQAGRDCRYGLQFRELPGPGDTRTNSNYAFVVDPTDQTYWLEYWPPGTDPQRGELLVPPASTTAIRPGTQPNRVAVVAQGDALRLFVNGQQVDDWHDARRPWGKIAWFAHTREPGAPLVVEFRHFVVTTPGPSATLRPVLAAP